ncbi:hypothetical protein ACB092_02G017200 [Castanea dentata]
MATQTACFASSSSSSWKYDAFLSFCGVDTRKNFTDHLYTALKQKGITTFRDDEELERGKYINSELLKAIEESKYAIIVLSRNYASSKWCLIELAKIVECMKDNGLTVLPVFYHVDSSDVRNQTGTTLIEAFAKHTRNPKINKEDVQAWKAALKEVGNISGWHLYDRHESKVIQEILQRIYKELNRKFLRPVSKDLVGIESRVKEMLEFYLDEGLGGVRFVGICGMGGIGKTTLAQEIYQRISGKFEASSFISKVREETKKQGLVSLQKQLLSKILMESEINFGDVSEGINLIVNRMCNKMVLIVLDDVDDGEQLEALAGKHDWFGAGSRIIITSRNSHLLRSHEVDDVYEARGLNRNEALELFSWRAFKKNYPEENYVDLSMNFVSYANGLPLALKVLGSSLFGRKTNAWRSALDKLKVEPDIKIMNILQISFDGLLYTEKELFLDIACFFKGEKNDRIRDILESFGYYPDYNIDILIDKSLITIDNWGTLWMHDLLQEMGHEIVRHESPKEPGGRTRLWMYEDVLHVLENNTGTDFVEGIVLNTHVGKVEYLKAFSMMKNLRLLKIGNKLRLLKIGNKLRLVEIVNMQLRHHLIGGNVELPQGLIYLSNELRALEWHGYPLKSFPNNFQPNKLVELRMHFCCIEQLWKGIMILEKLKFIDLSDSQNLIETPDFNGVLNLRQLILQRCTTLSKVHESLGNLKRLIRLDLRGCECLESLPHKINLESLEVCILSGCLRLRKFPETVGNMSRLSELYLDNTAIEDLSVEHFIGLVKLDISDCKNLSKFPNVSRSLTSLKTLTLSGCSKLDELPEYLGNVGGLEELDVSGTAIRELPSSILLLKNLKFLCLHGCEELLGFPLMQQRSPNPMGILKHSLIDLDLSYCNIREIPDDFGCLSSLKQLVLDGNSFVVLPNSIIGLSELKSLSLKGCTSLRSLPKLPLGIQLINASGCTSLETFVLWPEDSLIPNLVLLNCVKLSENQGYVDMLLTILRHHLIKMYHIKNQLQNGPVFPGCEIPKWFSHQNSRASMNLQVPSDLCNKFMGIAVCVVFVFFPFPYHPFIRQDDENTLRFSVKANGILIPGTDRFKIFGKLELYQHHLYMRYLPSPFFGKDWEEALSQSHAVATGFSHQIEITFEIRNPGMKVTTCGARLVYEQDIEALIPNFIRSNQDIEDARQTKAECSSSIISITHNYDEDVNRAVPCGEGTSNDVDTPHPKRIQLPNLIERLMLCLGKWIGNLCTQGQGDSDYEEEESQ